MNGVSNEDDEMLLKLILDKIGECKNLNLEHSLKN